MDRRTFATLSSVALLDLLLRPRMLRAAPDDIAKWLRDIQTLCRDLRTTKLTAAQWQAAIVALPIPLDELVKLVDLDAVTARFEYPERGVVTHDPLLPRLDGGYRFVGRIFGMAKGRAVIPHGHRNMVSSHRVIGGELRLRTYDRVKTHERHLWLRPAVDDTAKLGSASAISDAKGNVHWLVATTHRAFTFDVIVAGLGGATGIDNLDIDKAERDGELLRVPKLDVDAALAKYG